MIRTLCLATVLVPGTALAQWSGECAAQAVSQEQGVSLSAAVEEARRSPFHAVPVAAGPGGVQYMDRRSEADYPAPLPHGPAQPQANLGPRVALLTYVTGGVSHLAAAYLFWVCGLDERCDLSLTRFLTALFIPLVAVPVPAVLAGATLDLGVSAVGLGVGAFAHLVALNITEQVYNADFTVASIVSGAVHAAVVNRMLR